MTKEKVTLLYPLDPDVVAAAREGRDVGDERAAWALVDAVLFSSPIRPDGMVGKIEVLRLPVEVLPLAVEVLPLTVEPPSLSVEEVPSAVEEASPAEEASPGKEAARSGAERPSGRFPTGLLLNTATGRYHPISFRYAPLPSADPWEKVSRYKSIGHHTAGFDTKEEALAFIARSPVMRLVEEEWEWDGVEMEAMVCWFANEGLS